jgi:phospholipid/cholesterol/gamma-HCH transport system substrate-binding protein
MAQQKQLTWADLRVGLFVLAGLTLTAVTIFFVTGSQILSPKYRLITYMPEVNGVQSGAPVDLDGIRVGDVQSATLTPHPQDRDHSVTLVLRIDRRYQDQIRTDSAASFDTFGLLGDRFVTISRGLTGTSLPNNGVLPSRPKAGTAEVVDSVNALTADLRELIGGIQHGHGTLGKLVADPALYNHLDETVAKIDNVAASIQDGKGSVGKLITNDDLYNKVDSTLDKVDDAMGAVHDQKGTLGKLIYDQALYQNVNDTAHNASAMLADVRAGKGTLGKLATDDALYSNVRDATANVRDVTAKLNSEQGTAGKLMNDPTLYNNVTNLTADMRLLIGDFRTNPKKFLHIKLGLF